MPAFVAQRTEAIIESALHEGIAMLCAIVGTIAPGIAVLLDFLREARKQV